MTDQLLRAGTSIGANIEEATQAQSRKDFIFKLSIAMKEAHEAKYWLRVLRDAGVAMEEDIDPLLANLQEVIRMLSASIRTAKLKRSLNL